MVNLYIKLIIAKRRTLNDVPEQYVQDVTNGLAELGYDTAGNKL